MPAAPWSFRGSCTAPASQIILESQTSFLTHLLHAWQSFAGAFDHSPARATHTCMHADRGRLNRHQFICWTRLSLLIVVPLQTLLLDSSSRPAILRLSGHTSSRRRECNFEMAEVIALTASLAGIIQLADYGIKFARVLSSLSRQIGTTFEEIEQFGLEVRSFSSLVLLAQTSLRHHCSEHDESPILAYIADNSILDGISRESDIVKRHVRDARRRVAAINSNTRILAVAKWTFHKKSILELSPEMEKIKSSISVILSTVQVELAALSLTRLPADATAERERLQSDL